MFLMFLMFLMSLVFLINFFNVIVVVSDILLFTEVLDLFVITDTVPYYTIT
jgi:hypothetical protein